MKVENQLHYINRIKNQVAKANIDNISRTGFYEHFFYKHTEVRWALLAGLVSRNAGWNMTDLRNQWFRELLTEQDQLRLFAIYECGNWTIFDDACPQLLLYEQSKLEGVPLFHLLRELGVSTFMEKEWHHFWLYRDEERLCTALIINEQHVIEEALIQKQLFRDVISSKLFYKVEQYSHFSYVVLPTITGHLYTLYVRRFQNVSSRIKLGRQLAFLLFHPDLHKNILAFMQHQHHTGSRRDYYTYTTWSPRVESQVLRLLYPVIEHDRSDREDWYKKRREVTHFFYPIKEWKPVPREKWIQHKWMMIYVAATFKKWLAPD
ncbi:DUF2515 family protein [Alkalicoccobacillus murimartini]|uniref:DUF2515 family protein n=1 Tax=Alkalicoccobacillus murimartini TaxID=171685 RepID=UPI0027D7BB0F|nr:DUF2515 family protein [Alkalicoccobacillus murimartini]